MAGILLNRSRQVPAEDTPAFGGIAERFRRAGDLDRAIALCREGLLKFPDQLSARVTLGWSLLDKGKYDEARAELERVLRRAPDNLAAIRGLAELHDRSEGAMPSMDERESWRHEELAQENAAAAGAAASAAAAPLVAADEDPFAPISVTLASASRQPSPEILHTADDAQQSAQAAATAAAVEALLGPDRVEVELENPAAAAMAAATPIAPAPAVTPIPEPTSEMLGGDDDSLEEAVAGLGIEVSAFDPGVAAPSPSASFSSFDTAEQESASIDLQLEGFAAQTPAMFEVESEAAPAPVAALDQASASEALLGTDVEFSDAADLVAALRSAENLEATDASSLVLEMPSGDAGLLDAELTAFEETQPSAVMPPDVSDSAEAVVEPQFEAARLSETGAADASPVMDVVATSGETADSSRDLIPAADMFELAGMTPVDAVVSARAYDVSAAPVEDQAVFAPEVPPTLLDEDRVAEVGRFELPERDSAEPEEAADEFTPVLASAEQVENDALEGAFALTNPEPAAFVEDASVEVGPDALASEAVALEASDDSKPILDLADIEIEEVPVFTAALADVEGQAELHAPIVEPADLTAHEQQVREHEAQDVALEIEQVSAVELIPDTVTEAFAGLPEGDVPVESDQEASLAAPLAALVEAAVEAHVAAEVVHMTTHAHGKKSSVAALERFLRQVENRRLQLQSGSVA